MRRGLILNLVSNILFFVCGYVIHFFLGNTLPAAEYGIVGTIMTVLDFEYMFLSNGARQSLAKEISLHRFETRDVIFKALGFQLILIAGFFALNFFGAPLFGIVFNDPDIVFYFKVAAFLIPANGLFVILLGINDGLHRFSTGAVINTLYPIAKLLVIPLILFVFQSQPVLGMEVGYLLALIISILIGLALLVPARKQLAAAHLPAIRFSEIARNTLSFSFFYIMVSLVLSLDTLVVKSVVSPAEMTGYYTGAVNLGKVPYYLVSAFCTIILPVVAKKIGQHDAEGAIKQVKDFIQVIVAVILPIPVILSASSELVLSVFYKPEYAQASPALSCLAFSNFFMGMTVLLNMVLTSFASNKFSDVLSIGSLVVVVPIFIATARFGGITWIATASVTCTFLTMLISYIVLRRNTGNLFYRNTLIALGLNVLLWLGTHLLVTAVHIPNLVALAGVYMFLYLLFLGILVAFRIIRIPEIRNANKLS